MVKIYWTGLADLMQSDEISKAEQQAIMSRFSQVQARFLQEFGFQGKFEVKSVTTSKAFRRGTYHGGRTSWRIVAADAKTTSALKRKPGWMSQFL